MFRSVSHALNSTFNPRFAYKLERPRNPWDNSTIEMTTIEVRSTQHATINIFEQRFLIITFISEMIQIHRDLKWIKIHLLTTKSSNNYEMFNIHKVSSVQKRNEKKSICSGCERWRKITLSKYSTTTTTTILLHCTPPPQFYCIPSSPSSILLFSLKK